MTLGVGAGQMSRVDSTRIAAIKAKNAGPLAQGLGRRLGRVLPVPRRPRRDRRRGREGGDPAGRQRARQGSDRRRRRARHGDGVHRHAALPALKLLVIGSGGREHALAWRLAQSPKVSRVYVAPGNAGTAREDGLYNVDITAIPELVKFAKNEDIHATVVGPEAPLAAGVVDAFRAAGLRIFGPTKAARAARVVEGLRQALHGAPRRFPPRATRPSPTRRRRTRYVDEKGAPIVDQGRRARRRQGRGGRDDARRGARGDRHDARGQQARRRGAPRRDRGIHGRRGGELHRHGGRQERAALRLEPGPQAHLRRRPGPQHRRHGRVLARAGRHARSPQPRDARDHHAHGEGHGGRRHSLHRLPLRGPDDRRRRRAARGRVQLPPGRPGDAADLHAPEERLPRASSSTPSTARSTRSRPNGTAAPRWAWCWPPRATPRRRARATRSPGCRRTPRTCTCSMPGPRSGTGRTARSSPTAGACCA